MRTKVWGVIGVMSAAAMVAAQNQGHFWEYHDVVFAHREALEDADLEAYASQVGMDLDQFRADIADPDTRDLVRANAAAAAEVVATGTPTCFIQGHRLMGAQPPAEFRTLIDAAIAEAGQYLDAGVEPAEVYARVLTDPLPPIEAPLAPLDTRWPEDQVPPAPRFEDYEAEGWPSCEFPSAEATWLHGEWSGRLDVFASLLEADGVDPAMTALFEGASMRLVFTPTGEMTLEAVMLGESMRESGTYEVVQVLDDRAAMWTVLEGNDGVETELIWLRFRTRDAVDVGDSEDTIPFERVE